MKYDDRMHRALETAKARATRSRPALQEVLASAVIRTELEPTPQVVVSFTAYPFKGGLHQIYEFTYIESASDRELSRMLAWSVRERIKQKLATMRGA